MARLIEFFSRDRRAGARPVRRRRRARCSAPRSRAARDGRSASSSIRAGRRSTSAVVRDLARQSATVSAPSWPTWAARIRAVRAASTRPVLELRRRRRPGGPADLESGSVDLVATDPPYNLQLPMTMAGGALAEAHANRRTDYAMVTDFSRRPRQRARLPDVPRPDGGRLRRAAAGPARPAATPSSSCATPTRTAATCSPARTSPRAPRASGSCPRATSSGTRPGRGCGRTATRGRSSRTSSTSTSWCCGRSPAGGQALRRRDAR